MARFAHVPPVPCKPLTPQQDAVARLVARGKTYQQIAAIMGWQRCTAEAYVTAIAQLLPVTADDVDMKPYVRVAVWAYWVYRANPEAGAA